MAVNLNEILNKVGLNDFNNKSTGVLSSAVEQFSGIPSIKQEMVPLFQKVAGVSAVFESMDKDYADAIKEVCITKIVASAEYVLEAMPESNLLDNKLMSEIQEQYMDANEADRQDLEALMMAIQVIETAFSGNAPEISESRKTEILYLTQKKEKKAPVEKDPAPQGYNPEGEGNNPSGGSGGYEPNQTVIPDLTFENFRLFTPEGEDTSLYELVTTNITKSFEHEKTVKEIFEKLKSKNTKKKVDVFTVLKCLFETDEYTKCYNRISSYCGFPLGNDDSSAALTYLKYCQTREQSAREISSIKKFALEQYPDIEALYNDMKIGASYAHHDQDSAHVTEYLILWKKCIETQIVSQMYDEMIALRRYGKYVPEAYLRVAEIYESVKKAKDAVRYDGKTYDSGTYDIENLSREYTRSLVDYFKAAHKRGGDCYKSAVYHIFYRLKDSSTFNYFDDISQYMVSSCGTADDEKAMADFFDLMHKCGYSKGIKQSKEKLLGKMLKINAKDKEFDDKFINIATAVYSGVLALITIISSIAFIYSSNTALCGIVALVLSVLLAFVHLGTKHIALEKADIFRKITFAAIPVSFVIQYLLRFGFSLPTEGFFPWSENSIFGQSFGLTFMIILPTLYLCYIPSRKMRYWVESTVVYHPIAPVVFCIAFCLLCTGSNYLQATMGSEGFIFDIILRVLAGAITLIPFVVMFFVDRLYRAFNENTKILMVFISLFSLVAGTLGLLNAIPYLPVEYAARLMLIQGLVFSVGQWFYDAIMQRGGNEN